MKFVMFGLLALTAIGVCAALLLGAPFGIVAIVLLAVLAATFAVSRFKGTLNLELDRRLPRALLTSDRR